MNLKILLVMALLLGIFHQSDGYAQVRDFESDVETEGKPWTHLNFYNDPQNFQIAIVSDNTGGNREGVFEKSIDRINLLKPEFVMCVGDLIQGYTQDTAQINFEWNEFNTSLEKLESPFFYLPGNHDITNPVMQKEWEKRYGRRYYNFIYKNVLFITMDSNDDNDFAISEDQMNYVITTLKENAEVRWIFIFMHHPIWTYDTEGRFENIESELKNRKYTVFAGHEHKYRYTERNGNNYYILATTGGGSALHGHRFGQFDHITWLTLTDDGPVFANLELNHILPHDISNDETRAMAESILRNSSFEHLLLTNKGNKFSEGTLYIYFSNSTNYDMGVEVNFFHNHDLFMDNSELNFDLRANKDTTAEISLRALGFKDFADLDLLQFNWSFSILEEKYQDFILEGKYSIRLTSESKSDYIQAKLRQFMNSVNLKFSSPFSDLIPKFTMDGSIPTIHSSTYLSQLSIDESTEISFALFNEKNQSVSFSPVSFDKVEMNNSVKVGDLSGGLKYYYYEGVWTEIPEFDKLDIKTTGLASNFLVSDLSASEDNFGFVFKGYIKIPADDMYIFRMRADDASKLFIHENLIIDDQKGSNYGAVVLEEGYHPIEIHYMENKGNQRLRMYYKNKEDEDWIFMPFEMFFTNK